MHAQHMAAQEDWERVADAVNRRMRVLGLSQIDLSLASGVSDTTIRELQQAAKLSYRQKTLSKVATALGWTVDSFDLILQGGAARVQPLENEQARAAHHASSTARAAALSGIDLSDLSDTELAQVRGYVDALRRSREISSEFWAVANATRELREAEEAERSNPQEAE